MILFWFFWSVDAVVALIFLYFFFVGLADGSVSSFNMGLWLGMMLALAAVLGGGYWLKTHGMTSYANTLVAILAVPSLVAGLFLLVVLISKPRWN